MTKLATLSVRLNCKTNYCGECRFKDHWRTSCTLFDQKVTKSTTGHFIRLPACKESTNEL